MDNAVDRGTTTRRCLSTDTTLPFQGWLRLGRVMTTLPSLMTSIGSYSSRGYGSEGATGGGMVRVGSGKEWGTLGAEGRRSGTVVRLLLT